jgi:glycosyltransferase involved in cell wall biosynthesis
MEIEASVVIATYKRPALLNRCLQSLINQSVSCNSYEIIIVSDGPDAGTRDAVKKAGEQFHECPHIVYFPLKHKRGPAAARNAGWRIAKAAAILFTDDDCIPSFFWIQNFLNAFKRNKKDEMAFAGRVVVPLPAKPTDHEKNTAQLECGSFVTANCACTKKALERIGGLDEDFTMAWREDTAFEFDLLEHNVPIIKISEAIVTHPVRKAEWGNSLKEQKKSMFNPLLYKKHPSLYQQKMHNHPPRHYYGIIFLAMISLIAAILQNNTAMLVSLFGCFILILCFAYKRLIGTSLAFSHIMEMIVTSVFIPFLSVFWTMYGSIRYKKFFI